MCSGSKSSYILYIWLTNTGDFAEVPFLTEMVLGGLNGCFKYNDPEGVGREVGYDSPPPPPRSLVRAPQPPSHKINCQMKSTICRPQIIPIYSIYYRNV